MEGIAHTLWITEKVNQVLGGPASALLTALGIQHDTATPLPQHLIITWEIIIILTILAYVSSKRISLIPKKLQHVWELFAQVILQLLRSVLGPKGDKYFSLIASMALFILIGNLMGLFPFSSSPTANLNTTVACALIIFFYYHFQGIKELGLKKYLKHFMGPSLIAAPFLIPIETISHCSRVLSLSVRLFGNIMGEDIVIIIIFSLAPLLAPVPMMAFAIFTSILQAFIFIMLSIMYLAGAVSQEH